MRNLISIIVPVYNVEKYLESCISSVLDQSYIDWELILIDDGSLDKSPEICDKYAQSDKRIKVVHKTNEGASVARNIGLDIASGEYITFLDSDDCLHKDYLRKMLDCLLENNADIVQCDFGRELSVFENITANKLSGFLCNNQEVFLKEFANIILCAKLYKKDLWDSVRMPKGKFYEDDFTTWKLYYKANRIFISSEKLYFYRVNPTSTMAQHRKKIHLDFIDAYNERISFFKDKGDRALEGCSRLQFAKALFLNSCNKNISKETYLLLRNLFTENWSELKRISGIKIKYRILFASFLNAPQLMIKIIRLIC